VTARQRLVWHFVVLSLVYFKLLNSNSQQIPKYYYIGSRTDKISQTRQRIHCSSLKESLKQDLYFPLYHSDPLLHFLCLHSDLLFFPLSSVCICLSLMSRNYLNLIYALHFTHLTCTALLYDTLQVTSFVEGICYLLINIWKYS
jgi:hypothetical protein